MDGWAPVGIGVFGLPTASGREDGGDFAAEARFFKFAEVEFVYFAYWGETIFEGHACGGDALGGSRASVVGEEEVEEFTFFVEDYARVAVTAGEEAVLGVAIDGVARFEDYAEVLDGCSVVAGDGGSDFGSGEVCAGAALLRFVVIEEEEGAVGVAPDGFKPNGAVIFGIEFHFAGVG